MSGAGSIAKLYTPAVLGLATELAAYPLDENAPLQATIRSRSCGSTLQFSGALSADGRIEAPGARVTACAIGQAAAALFLREAAGSDAGRIDQAIGQVGQWLAGQRSDVDWPGLDAIAAARNYPGRHEAILLPWKAARDALSNAAPLR